MALLLNLFSLRFIENILFDVNNYGHHGRCVMNKLMKVATVSAVELYFAIGASYTANILPA
jgi:hypothetical protein